MGTVDIAKASDFTSFGRDRGSGATPPATGNRRGDVFFLTTGNYLVTWNGTVWVPTSNQGFPYARMHQTVPQSNFAAGWNLIIMNVADFDSHNGFVSAQTWVCPTNQGGLYRVEASVAFSPTRANEVMAVRLGKGTPDTTVVASQQHTSPLTAGGGPLINSGSHMVQLNAGQYVYVQGYSSIATWGTSVGAAGNEGVMSSMQVERIR